MRSFIAIELVEEVRGNVGRIQERLRASDAHVKWVKPGNIHLTLKFLGEISDVDAHSIKASLDEIGKDFRPFPVAFSGLGFFPSQQRPRVIWIGPTEGVEKLRELASRIDNATATLGIPKEKREFSPHLTLGRIKSGKNLEELLSLVEKNRDFVAGCFIADEMHLIKSVLSPSGPTYSKLHTTLFSE